MPEPLPRRHPFRTRAGRKLRDQVVDEEPECRLAYPGICTGASQTADHIEHWSTHPELGLERTNLRGACNACNWHRGKRTDAQVAAAGTTAPQPRAPALAIFKPLP